MLTIGIVGATGYTGVVLMSLLLTHPDARIDLITSNTYRGRKISDIFPLFKDRFEKILEPTDDEHRGKCDVYFLCLPHGTSMNKARELFDGKAVIVDLSADFRFEDRATYEKSYVPHIAPELIPQAVFGLPELYRPLIKGKKLIGNPGCYPTSAILALYPLIKDNMIEGDIFIDSKSGVSGAGREGKIGSLFCEVSEGFRAYSVGVHRHEPEIQKEVAKYSASAVSFVPHLVPMSRGILTTVYGRLAGNAKTADIITHFRETYKNDHFVRILDENIYPDTRFVRFSNYCDIGLKVLADGRIIIISTIDNLVKGASGQAVQNMNVALGLDESLGLAAVPQYP
ncbi:MAG: N-acetyl-gamma-glutamyl-phosphate reductase [Syntrophorhabdus sp.]